MTQPVYGVLSPRELGLEQPRWMDARRLVEINFNYINLLHCGTTTPEAILVDHHFQFDS